MPLFLVYAPDYPNNVEARLKVRPEHQAASAESKAAGTTLLGRAFFRPETGREMAGSAMLYRYDTLDEAWARLKSDTYWKNGVWDKEKCQILELATLDGDDKLAVVVKSA